MQVLLTVAKGRSAGRQIPITVSEFLIGRGDECHLRPKSDAVSRRHCQLSLDDEQLWIEDLGSKNGTLVNGEKIAQRTSLSDGDRLQVGKLLFDVSIMQPRPDATGDDVNIADWLEADEAEEKAIAGPETRQFRLDETTQAELKRAAAAQDEEAAANSGSAEPEDSTVQAEQETEASKDDTTGFFLGPGKNKNKKEDKPAKDKENKKPKKLGKLPPSGPQSASSTAAAAETLKKFFNNRG